MIITRITMIEHLQKRMIVYEKINERKTLGSFLYRSSSHSYMLRQLSPFYISFVFLSSQYNCLRFRIDVYSALWYPLNYFPTPLDGRHFVFRRYRKYVFCLMIGEKNDNMTFSDFFLFFIIFFLQIKECRVS